MNKKLIISLSIIGIVSAIAIGATVAYYNDTETSTGNIFVAGTMDLKVDHTKQTYNGDDCQSCSLTLYSGDGGAWVTNGVNTVLTSFPFPAVEVTTTSITQQYWTTYPPAKWIWASDPTLVGDDGTNGNVTYTFEHKFNWWGGAVDVDLLMSVAADNQYQILLNGTPIASGLGSAEYTTLDPVAEGAFLGAVQPGENTLTFIVTNLTQENPAYNTPLYNPGGLLYYLNVERNSEDCNENSQFLQNCRLWTEKDLELGDIFFNFEDVKPGDWGTNIISLHVFDNDAFACLLVTDTQDNENICVDPEIEANDTTCNETPDQGELSDYLSAVVWQDTTQNNAYDSGEPILYDGLLKNIKTMDRIELVATTTDYIGIAWCLGDQTLDQGAGTISCSGIGNQDIAQTDSFLASLTIYAIQQRNNSEFSCVNVALPQ